MSDPNDALLGYQAQGGLQPHHQVVPGRAHNRAVGLGPDRNRAQVGGRRHRRTRRGATRIKVEHVGIPGETSTGAPAVDEDSIGAAAPKIGPLREVGLAQDDCPGRSHVGDYRRIGRYPAAQQGQRTGCGLHGVVGGDVVL